MPSAVRGEVCNNNRVSIMHIGLGIVTAIAMGRVIIGTLYVY